MSDKEASLCCSCFEERLSFFGRLVLCVLAEISVFPRPKNLLGQFDPELILNLVKLVLQLFANVDHDSSLCLCAFAVKAVCAAFTAKTQRREESLKNHLRIHFKARVELLARFRKMAGKIPIQRTAIAPRTVIASTARLIGSGSGRPS